MMSAAAAMIMGTLVIAPRRQLPNLGSFASLKFSDRTPPCRSIAVRATAQAARQRAADQLTPAPEPTEREEAGL
jgi:hypothetical protein